MVQPPIQQNLSLQLVQTLLENPGKRALQGRLYPLVLFVPERHRYPIVSLNLGVDKWKRY